MQDAILSMDTMQQTINITYGWGKKKFSLRQLMKHKVSKKEGLKMSVFHNEHLYCSLLTRDRSTKLKEKWPSKHNLSRSAISGKHDAFLKVSWRDAKQNHVACARSQRHLRRNQGVLVRYVVPGRNDLRRGKVWRMIYVAWACRHKRRWHHSSMAAHTVNNQSFLLPFSWSMLSRSLWELYSSCLFYVPQAVKSAAVVARWRSHTCHSNIRLPRASMLTWQTLTTSKFVS